MPIFTSITLNRGALKQVALWSVIIVFVFAVLLFYYEANREDRVYQEIFQSIDRSSLSAVNKLTTDINTFKRSIQLLSELPSIHSYLDINQDIDANSQESIREDISIAFKALLKQEYNIRQARLITQDGNEYVRVDRNNTKVTVTPYNSLQSKANRRYFKTGIRLSSDELYISEISPNYEHGKIERPLWPTYRIIKALRNASNENVGILVLNVDASKSLNTLNANMSSSLSTFQFEYYLVNQNGYYVAAPDKSLLFGKDLGKPDMSWFTHTNNAVPLSDTKKFQTFFRDKYYLFSSKELYFSTNDHSPPYFLLAALPIDRIDQMIQSQRKELFFSIFSFGLVISIIIYLSLRHIRNLEGLYLNQSRFKAIILNSSDAILSINQEGMIQSWNYASSLLFGLKEDQALGQSFFNLINEDSIFNEAYLKDILESNSNKRIEVPLKNDTKQKRTLLLTLCPIQKKDGNNESIALIIRDITFQKENQEKLETANQNLDAEVKKRTEQLEAEKQKAIKANDTKSMFVANISHEIRTPLNGISGLLSLARNQENTEKQDNYLRMAQESAKTLNVLINDLLDLSKIESGKLELSPSPTHLISLLESIISSVFFLIKDKNIELILDTSRVEINSLMLDENRLKQVLTNLLSNAIKFTTEGEVILTASSYYTSAEQDKVECNFQISDTGMGISKDQQARLFKPFVQASSGISNKFGGTGLGLSISKQLCEMMEGTIELESQTGEGSTFKAKILATKADSKHTDLTQNNSINVENRKVAILIKNDALRRVLRNTLNNWKISVQLIKDIDELRLTLHSTEIDTVLLDSEFYHPSLESSLNEHGLSTVYLCKNNELVGKISDNRLLNKPVISSYLLNQLSKENLESSQPSSPFSEPTPSETSAPSMKGQKVFIVDDNEINQIVARGILTMTDADIETAYDGENIIHKLKQLSQTDTLPVILMDCQMPIMNGYEATRLIREGSAGEWLKSVPIIALTADAMDQNIEECKAAGMDDFLGKPFDPETLKAKVQQWAQKNAF